MEIKDKILQAAFKLFMRHGIKSVSMDDIALNIGVSKKTLYKWFDNKDQLVLTMIQQEITAMEGECCSFTIEADNAIEELFSIMEMVRQKMAGMHPSLFYDLEKYHRAAWQVWTRHKNEFILKQIYTNIKKGIAQGWYRSDLDVDILARIRLAQIQDVFNPELFPPDKFDLQKVQIVTLEHFMMGIATLKGHKLINKYKEVTEEE